MFDEVVWIPHWQDQRIVNRIHARGGSVNREQSPPCISALVRLRRTSISDAGLVHVAILPSLHRLVLEEISIGHDGIAQLRSMQNLSVLALNKTHVTDIGLAYLMDMRSLEQVLLFSSNVTDVGVEELKSCLPFCAIGH